MKKTISLLTGLIILLYASVPAGAEDTVHIVKEGDTLWDISSAYLDTPWKWPLVWATNNDITNPHLIYPNDRVVISRRGGKTTITIIPAQEVEAPQEPVVYTPEEISEEKDKSIVISPKFSTYIYSPNILKGSGTVFKKQGIGEMASKNEIVLIKSPSGLAPNYGITIVSKIADVKKNKTIAGYLYKAVAIAMVEDLESGVVKARIIYSTQEVMAGDIVLDDLKLIEPLTVNISEPELSTKGHVIDFYGGISGSSELDLVFMDIGLENGINKGALLSIYEETVLKDEDVTLANYQGMAIVIQSLNKTCMGLIIESKGPIKRDYTVLGAQ